MASANDATTLQRRFLTILAVCAAMLCGLILTLPTPVQVAVDTATGTNSLKVSVALYIGSL